MNGKLELRGAKEQDIPAILRVQQASSEAPRWSESAYREILRDEDGSPMRRALFVAVKGDRLAGFVAAAIVLDEAEIESIAVDLPMRRQGVGKALAKAALAWAGEMAAKQMRLEVRSANTGAQALYCGLGFQVAGVRRGYYFDPPDDAVLMELTIARPARGLADL